MAQTKFHYDYGDRRHAYKQAKRLRSHEHYTVVVQNPKTGRYLVLMCDTDEDLPTRVPILDKLRDEPPARREWSEADRMNALHEMIEQGVILISVVNNGASIGHESLSEVADEWIENQSIDWSRFE